jgi:hypothetical protein
LHRGGADIDRAWAGESVVRAHHVAVAITVAVAVAGLTITITIAVAITGLAIAIAITITVTIAIAIAIAITVAIAIATRLAAGAIGLRREIIAATADQTDENSDDNVVRTPFDWEDTHAASAHGSVPTSIAILT